jgi:hypothetical protein
MCPHQSPRPPADRPGRDAARTIACPARPRWSLLRNRAIVCFNRMAVQANGRGACPVSRIHCWNAEITRGRWAH